ncbi:MAG TPA: hypothetical protein VGS13_04680 [Stellaceae bacterium]|nr:hypothetical protein [Stellaceae bacterium]
MRNDQGFVLTAEALAPPVPPTYPPFWFCTHEDGGYHENVEEAMSCPQYEEFMRQVR